MNHIMVDLETFDTGTDAMVLSIGAVAFDPGTGKIGSRFYVELNDDNVMKQQIKAGRTVSDATVKWWDEQSEEARVLFNEGFGNRVKSLYDGLDGFTDFVHSEMQGTVKDVKVWGNGAAFDNVILRNLYKAVGLTPPWWFYNDSCYRTMKNLPGARELRSEFVGVPHYALDDALHQTNHLLEIFRCLELTPLSA